MKTIAQYFLIVIHILNFVQSDEYVSERDSPIFCEEWTTCHRKHGQSSMKAHSMDWLEQCNCDAQCLSFGDCCSDVNERDLGEPLKLTDWSILSTNGPRTLNSLNYIGLMRSRCPQNYPK